MTPKSRKMRTRVCLGCGETKQIRADNHSEYCHRCATNKQWNNARLYEQEGRGWEGFGEWKKANPGLGNPNAPGWKDIGKWVKSKAGTPEHPGFKHGQTGSPTWTVWRNMLQRCENPKSTGYELYGGRGISVCERWHDFKKFMKDMGERPEDFELHRLDNDKGYEQGNCVWINKEEHGRITRMNANERHAQQETIIDDEKVPF